MLQPCVSCISSYIEKKSKETTRTDLTYQGKIEETNN